MDHFIEDLYIYEKNIIYEQNYKIDNDSCQEKDKKIIKYNNYINLCQNEDTLHICCGLISSLTLFACFKIF